jgi:hypothetical protein
VKKLNSERFRFSGRFRLGSSGHPQRTVLITFLVMNDKRTVKLILPRWASVCLATRASPEFAYASGYNSGINEKIRMNVYTLKRRCQKQKEKRGKRRK